MNSDDILQELWRASGLPDDALEFVDLNGLDPVFPSSFRVGAAAQSTIAAAALAACELGFRRGSNRQRVSVDIKHAAVECTGWFSLDGRVPEPWDKFSGLYRCADGYVRLHANFRHHRDGALHLLGLNPETAERSDAEQTLLHWRSIDFEEAAAKRNLVATALRRFEDWDNTPQGQALSSQPLFTIDRINERTGAHPLMLPPLVGDDLPLKGLRVLDLTRILAGPVGGRALAAYGADVMLINSPNLPNIESIADTSRGKLSVHADLHTEQGRATLERLIADAHVFIQGYRPGGMSALGYGVEEVARLRPGIVYATISAYGTQGPWAFRRGFDSLVQTAMGFNCAEGEISGDGKPRPMPMQILDQATGYLLAFGVAAAVCRQQREGGSWHVQVSLAQTGQWLRRLGSVIGGFNAERPNIAAYLEIAQSGFGELQAVRHSAHLARTPVRWHRPSMPPGSSPPAWP